MSPEHREALEKRGIVYKPWPKAIPDEDVRAACADGCGTAVHHKGLRCWRCKHPRGEVVAARPRKYRCACDDPNARKVAGLCKNCYERSRTKRAA